MTPEEVHSYIDKWVQARNTGRIEINFIKGEIRNVSGTYYSQVASPASPEAKGKEIGNGLRVG